jgi:hypothetical protein
LLLDATWMRDMQARLAADTWRDEPTRGAVLLAWAVFVSPHGKPRVPPCQALSSEAHVCVGHRNDGGPVRADGGRAPPPLAERDVEALFVDAIQSYASFAVVCCCRQLLTTRLAVAR